MKLALLSLAFVFGSTTLFAQNGGTQRFKAAGEQSFGVARVESLGASPATARIQVSQGCPVAMRLNQQVNAALRQAGKGQKASVLAASLHLEISNALNSKEKAAAVKAAKVTVQGYDSTPRFELVSSSAGLPVRTVNIRFSPVAGDGASADFFVNGIVSASQLRIDSLIYANGTTWMPARGESCIVTPDPFMLVSAH